MEIAIRTHWAVCSKRCSPSESEEEAPAQRNTHSWSVTVLNCSRVKQMSVTFHIDLSGRGVGAIHVRCKARVASSVFFKSLGDDQRVELAVVDDLNIRAVFQLFALTEPPAIIHMDRHGFEKRADADNKITL